MRPAETVTRRVECTVHRDKVADSARDLTGFPPNQHYAQESLKRSVTATLLETDDRTKALRRLLSKLKM